MNGMTSIEEKIFKFSQLFEYEKLIYMVIMTNFLDGKSQSSTFGEFWFSISNPKTLKDFLSIALRQCFPNFLSRDTRNYKIAKNDSLITSTLTVWKGKFWRFEKEIFDGFKRKFLTVWKRKFWRFEKKNFDGLKRKILTVWKGKFWRFEKKFFYGFKSKFSWRHTSVPRQQFENHCSLL